MAGSERTWYLVGHDRGDMERDRGSGDGSFTWRIQQVLEGGNGLETDQEATATERSLGGFGKNLVRYREACLHCWEESYRHAFARFNRNTIRRPSFVPVPTCSSLLLASDVTPYDDT